MGGEGSTTHGIGGEDLSMPISYTEENAEVSTGMRFFGVRSHGMKAVKDYILQQVATYDKYEPTIWDCEDHCFLAASELRCKFLGIPVAIALGTGKVGAGIAGKPHALLVIWFSNQGKWERKFFDPTYKDFVNDFDTKVLIPLPISGFTKDNQDLSFEKNLELVETGAWALDVRSYNYGPITNGEVMHTLTTNGVGKCREKRNDEEWEMIKTHPTWYWSAIDETFWIFAHLRRTHKGVPIGFAVGTSTRKPKFPNPYDDAALVLWKQPDDYYYYNPIANKTLSSMGVDFNPRIVIV